MILSILATTKLAIKQCFKTCYAWLLLVLSILCIAGAIGRGSELAMVRQISLCWLPLAIVVIFGVGILWMGCSSIANDIEEKRFIGTAVAPVKKSSVWIGRWLGLVLSTALLLAIVFFMIGINGKLAVGSERPHDKLELLPESREQTINEIYEQMLIDASRDAGGEFVQNKEQKLETMKELKRQLSWQYFPLAAGAARTWDFSLESFSLKPQEKIYLKLAFLSMSGTTGGADGMLKIYNKNKNELVAEFEMSSDARGNVYYEISTDKLVGASTVRVVFENASEQAEGSSVLIGYEESLEVFAPIGGFWQNLFYAYLMCLGLLSIMAAMGISFGMQYSFPVAIFSAFVVMLMLVIASGNAINEYDSESSCGHKHNGEEEKTALFSEVVRKSAQGVSSAVHYTTSAFIDEEPLSKLGSNRTISGSKVFEWSVISFIIIPFSLCIIGSVVLSKKEYK